MHNNRGLQMGTVALKKPDIVMHMLIRNKLNQYTYYYENGKNMFQVSAEGKRQIII